MEYLYAILFAVIGVLAARLVLRLIPIRWLMTFFVALAAGLSATAFFGWIDTDIPDESNLETVTGTVVSVSTRNDRSKDLIFVLDPGAIRYAYVDWYPQYTEVRAQLKVGRTMSVLSGPLDPETREAELWALEIAGKVRVTYNQLSGARRGNSLWALGLGIAFSACTVIIFIYAQKCWMPVIAENPE